MQQSAAHEWLQAAKMRRQAGVATEEEEVDGSEDEAIGASHDASSDEDDEDSSGNEMHEESGDEDVMEEEELEREWAATVIQQAWKLHRQQQQTIAKTPETKSGTTKPREEPRSRRKESVCCNCFGLIETPMDHDSGKVDAVTNQEDGQAFCAACLYTMAQQTTSVNHPHALASPLPKLSQLVQAEAKYQDQLRLLRSQQELLRRQQDEIQARKDAQAKQLAVERELARERRRHFQLAMAKKRDEERKFQQFAAAVSSSSPEDEDDDHHDGFTAPQSTPLHKKTTKSKKKKRMKEIIPIPLRKAVLAYSLAGDSPNPFTLPGLEKHSTIDGGGVPSQSLPESKSQEQRKKQSRLNMAVCYAQDLTPLVNGQKPKRIIPLPAPTATSTTLSSSSHGQPDPGAKNKSRKMQLQPQPQIRSTHSKTKMPRKKTTSQPVKLRPIELSVLKSSNNQHDEYQHDCWDSVSNLSLPSSYAKPSSSPLTAEIKPMSWVYELGKSVLDEELRASVHSVTPATHESLHGFDTAAPLPSVQEEDEYHAASFHQPQRKSVYDLHLQRQLPSKTILSPSISLATAPITKSSTTTLSSTPVAPNNSSASSQQPQWEYSSDRLASLLEKYNVSVSTK
ncbi:hypothetical protein FI667_g14737, partial [Globisporangium splendens]